MERNETLLMMRDRYMAEYWQVYNNYNNMPYGIQLKYYNEYESKCNKYITLVDVLDRVLRVQGYYHE